MTQEQLTLLLQQPKVEDIVSSLQVENPAVPKWADLKKQYNPLEHEIVTNFAKYPLKLNKTTGVDDFPRIPLSLQKLAVSRTSQAIFASPAQRIYSYDKENKAQGIAADILEQIYSVENSIAASNIERAKMLNASCQVATIWRSYDSTSIIKGETATKSVAHRNFSEMEGYKLYPIFDDNKMLLAFSVGYTSGDVEYLDTYINGDTKQYISFVKADEWLQNTAITLTFFPVMYLFITEPAWGGDAGTLLVEQMEAMNAYQSMYIKDNSMPAFGIYYGSGQKGGKDNPTGKKEDPMAKRTIIKLTEGGFIKDFTWQGATEATKNQYEIYRNAFFEQIQLPDISFANMINSNTSAENKELVFADSKAKAKDLGGEWEIMFYREIMLVKEFAKVIFPKYATQFDEIVVRSEVRPYSVVSKKEKAEFVATAGFAMSKETQVRELGLVDDISDEVAAIEAESAATNNIAL